MSEIRTLGPVGLNPMIIEQVSLYFHTNDTIHPNATGHKLIANEIVRYLNTIPNCTIE